jgi:hypothetical protein
MLMRSGIAPSHLFATEYNQNARQELLKLGVSASDQDIRDLPPAKHAVVCGHQVIQHLADLDGVFRAFNSLTALDGVVALSISNGKHKANQEAAGGLFDMPPNHISTWRRSSFEQAAMKRGWKVVDYEEQEIARLAARRALAVSRTHRSRREPGSITSLLDRYAPSPRIRYGLMAACALARLPRACMTTDGPFGGSIWVLMQRGD